jgi:integrase
MSVYSDAARGTWFFTLRVPTPDGKTRQIRRRGFATKKAAELAEAKMLVEASKGRPAITPARLTFGDFLTMRWLPALEADPKRKPATIASYRHAMKHLVRHLGHVRLLDLSGDQLTVLYGKLRKLGKSERTVRGVHVTAHLSLKDAARWRLVSFNAADDATAPAQTAPDPTAWTVEQVTRFLELATADRWSALWRLAATGSMRRGELVGLQWSALDLDRGELVVRDNAVVVDHTVIVGTTKGKRARRVSLDPGTVLALRQWRRQQRAERLAFGEGYRDTDDVWTWQVWTWQDGTRVHPDVISRTYKRLREAAGLPALRLHNLRHAWATHALDNGADIKDVSTRLGHSSTRITMDIYVAPLPERDARAAAMVADLYDGKVTRHRHSQ